MPNSEKAVRIIRSERKTESFGKRILLFKEDEQEYGRAQLC